MKTEPSGVEQERRSCPRVPLMTSGWMTRRIEGLLGDTKPPELHLAE